jgi:alkylmercury lyase
MASTDATTIADRLACCVQELVPAEQRAHLLLFRLLAQGAPVPPARLAAATGTDESQVTRWLARWHGAHTSDGEVIAFQGLSLTATPHRFRVDGCDLYTWCAWDTMFLPELLGRSAQVESTCPIGGQRIRLTVGPDGPRGVDPADTVLSFQPHSPVFVDDVQESFCRFVHFFSSPAAAQTWIAEHPGTIVLTLASGFEIGRRTNAAQLGDALQAPTVELLYFDGCPSYEQLLPTVKRLAEQAGAALQLRRVDTAETAEREHFLGSPTVRVDGTDVDPTAADRTDFGLKCRIYRSADGQSPVPPEDWIRFALDRSTVGESQGILRS